MNPIQALVLGLIQGLTEFLPISSSGHLVLVPTFLGWDTPPVAFDVLLHAATLLAVVIYFGREFFEAVEGLDRSGPQRRFAMLLVVGTLPGAFVGVVFETQLEARFEDPTFVAAALIATGLILAGTETYSRRMKRDEGIEGSQYSNVEKISMEVTPVKALIIGSAQALAILPGISRSGSTIGTGLLTGLSRPQAARFSFMLSAPLIVGAIVGQLPRLETAEIGMVSLVVGASAAFVSSYVAIAGMIGYLQRRGLYPFAAYCLVVGIAASAVLRAG